MLPRPAPRPGSDVRFPRGIAPAQVLPPADREEFTASPPPHATGGAVDVTLCDPSGRELDLGQRAWTAARFGMAEASALGNILIQARAAGFEVRPAKPFARYLPRGDRQPWREAARRLGMDLT